MLEQYGDNIKNIWNNLNKKARIVIGISLIGVLSLLLFIIIWGRSASYEVLFSNLNPEDAEEIVNNLEQKGISYKLENNGRTIKVPSTQVHRTRLNMAGEGLPTQGVVGFEIFDKSQFGTTDFEREVNYYRAVSGELSRSIRAMEPIDFAKVQVTGSKDSLFVEEEEPAAASVLLQLNSGVSLQESQIKAISNLVASSVQDLSPENVTIVDSRGNHLSAYLDEEDDSTGIKSATDKFEIRRQFESRLKSDLKNMLTSVLGMGNFSVQVQAEMNFDQKEIESKSYDPVVDDEGIIRSQEELNESYTGSGDGPGGVPGTSSNIPQYEEEDENSSITEYEKENIIRNYEIDEKIEKEVYSPGKVSNLSVSVIVNEDIEGEVLQNLEESVKAAIGFSDERNDTVNVTALPFDRTLETELEEARAEAMAREARQKYLYFGLIGLILILLFSTFIILKRRKSPEPEPGERVDIQVGEGEEGAEGEEEIEQAFEEAASELSEEEKKRKQIRDEIENIVYEQPENVAEVLKSWLMEE